MDTPGWSLLLTPASPVVAATSATTAYLVGTESYLPTYAHFQKGGIVIISILLLLDLLSTG